MDSLSHGAVTGGESNIARGSLCNPLPTARFLDFEVLDPRTPGFRFQVASGGTQSKILKTDPGKLQRIRIPADER